MTAFQALDVGFGLIFIFLLLSLICTAVNEIIASIFGFRAQMLKQGIGRLLDNPALIDTFYKNSLIKSLSREGKDPSYISARTFRMALTSLAKVRDLTKVSSIRDAIVAWPVSPDLRNSLLALIDDAGGNIEKIKLNIEKWFDDTMERVTGWYVRRMKWISLIVACVITIGSNADTISITKAFIRNPALREAVAAQAQAYTERSQADSDAAPSTIITNTTEQIKQMQIPLGWPMNSELVPDGWLNKIIGLLLTTIAISLGAPFWFDLLQRVAKIRGSGAQPQTAEEERIKDE